MKKILLATSAIVAMSSVAVAGDIPAAPMAPMVAGWTVTASGEIMAMGWFTTPGNAFGVNYNYEGQLKAAKTLDDGSDVFVQVDVAAPSALTAVVGYNSSVGNFKGGIQAAADHDVEIPTAPGLPDVPDLLTFEDVALFVSPAVAVGPWSASDFAVTYASPTLGGFQLGLGVTGASNFNAVLAGSFDVSGATVKVGASAAGATGALAATVVGAGASVAVSGFTVGADYQGSPANAFGTGAGTITAGASYAINSFTVGVNYVALDNAIAAGTIGAGVGYSEGDLNAALNGGFNLGTNAITANAGATYKFGDFLVGAGGTFTTVGNAITAHAGVDYSLNSNVTLGAGATFSTPGNNIGVGAGVKVSF